MELKKTSAEVEEFGLGHEQSFSISEDDMGMIFELLRSKMYQNPIGSICREVASNSRDANREAGKPTVPVNITIAAPNEMFNISDLSIIFEDKGPGISPERMSSVFLKYAASTKRSTNQFTGGFGLGAKTPFAYTDVFHIITVHDGIKYQYLAYIDPSQKGKISQVSKTKTGEENGTKIVVPIKNGQDRQRFEQEVINATTFWDVRPNLKNFNHGRYPSISEKLSCVDTEGHASKIINYSSGYDTASYIACIDGIAYRLNTDILKLSNLNVSDHKIVMNFPNGMLNISSNRETLQYDDATIKMLKDRIALLSKHLHDKFTNELASSKDLFHALVYYRGLNNSGNHLYSIYKTIGGSLGRLAYKGTDLEAMNNLDFSMLQFAQYNVAQLAKYPKPMIVDWRQSVVLKNPIYVCDTKLDSRRIETLKAEHTDFTIVTLPKVKFGRYDHPKTDAALEKKKEAQLAQLKKFTDYGLSLNFDDVVRAEPLTKEQKRVKPDYTQIPVRAFVGSAIAQVEAVNWGSQSLKYDRANDKFLFEKFPQVIFMPVSSLNEISNDDDMKSIVGQMASFYLNLPIVVVNERFEKNFKTQLTIDAAIKKVDVKKFEAAYDHALIKSKNIDGSIKAWDKLTFPKQIQDSINLLKTYLNSNAYKGACIRDANVTLKSMNSFGLKPSKEVQDALNNFESIVKVYPLLGHFNNRDFQTKGFVEATQHYINNLK